jgi:hypothetical protein
VVYFTPIWYILWEFGVFCGNMVHDSRFGMLYQEKSGNPASEEEARAESVGRRAQVSPITKT